MTPAELHIARLPERPAMAPEYASGWRLEPWCGVPAVHLSHPMGPEPEHRPPTSARLGWDDDALYAIFRVEDRFVRATATGHQQPVCRDSCVEWFFAPAGSGEGGYFNVEVNCGGRCLLQFRERPRDGRERAADPAALAELDIARSLPAIVDPEIAEPVTWTVEYRLPFSVLESLYPFTRPTAGTVWCGNLYKCADATSHPHWLTWAPVAGEQPDFHKPECFGRMVFDAEDIGHV